MFELSFGTDSDAFIGIDKYNEAARILRRLADSLEAHVNEGPVLDVNGNRMGAWYIKG